MPRNGLLADDGLVLDLAQHVRGRLATQEAWRPEATDIVDATPEGQALITGDTDAQREQLGLLSPAVTNTPVKPAEGRAITYWVGTSVVWPPGIVWSDDPDGGVPPVVTGAALVSMVTIQGVTFAVTGSVFTPPDNENPSWDAVLTTGVPSSSSVVVTTSQPALDNIGVTGYEVSINNGSTWASIVPNGLNFTVTGLAASTTYPAPRFRAKDGAGNLSPVKIAQGFTTAAWSPANLGSTLMLWLDAADTSTIVQSGGLVSQWNDKSGAARHVVQPDIGARPRSGSQTLNGKNVLVFDGTDRFAWGAPFGIGTANTVMMVCTPSTGTDDYLLKGADAAGTYQHSFITGYDGKAFEFYADPGGPRFTIGAAGAVGAHLIGAIRNGNSVSGRYDGAPSGSGTLGGDALGAGRVVSIGGAEPDSNDPNTMTGNIAEIVICSSALSGAALASIESYLKTKWGIA